jgi:glycosyltransferase involved in cell wall biosynthesis
MRVAFDARLAARGLGISTFITHLAGELVGLGEVELIWLGDPDLAPRGAAAAVALRRSPYPLLDGPLGRALIRRLNPDVMHFTSNTGWGRSGPVPYVLTLHDLIFLRRPTLRGSLRQAVGHPYERRLLDRALRAAARVAVPSQTVADQVLARFGAVLRPDVILEGVAAPPRRTAAVRPPAPYVVAFTGRDPRKRTVDVIDAWRSLGETPIRLVLFASAGLPPGVRERLSPELRDGRVELVGHVPRERLWEILEGALALAYPSDDEGFGLPVLEGMAAGTPVLGGLAPAIREIGGDALVPLEPDRVAASLAAAILRVHADPQLRSAIVDRGLDRAAEFTWRRTALAYCELYREAIAARR